MAASSQMAFKVQLVVPEQRQLYDYWLERAGEKDMPSRTDINPAHIPKLLPYISLIDVEDGRFRVRLAGTRLRDFYKKEITGRYLDEMDWDDKGDYWLAAYARVVEEGRPAQGVVRSPRHDQDHLVQFWLRLPLTCDTGGKRMILCYDAFIPFARVREVTGDVAAISQSA